MQQTIEDRIMDFTAAERGTKREEILLDSRLLQDLGMDGDDAVDFFEAFGRTFGVKLERLWLNWHQHFRSEGFLQGLPFRPLEVPITVQDLVDSVKQGRWLKTYRGELGTQTH